MPAVLGLDTSNYTTSAAWFDGESGDNAGKLLAVPAGSLGLRQSEALFQHVKRLPDILADLKRTVFRTTYPPLGQAPGPGRWRAPICPASWRGSPRPG